MSFFSSESFLRDFFELPKTEARTCVWMPEVRESGRVSTMFFNTECGSLAAPIGNDRSKYKFCYLCGGKLKMVDRRTSAGDPQ
jgi:hypothetical protein